MKLSDECPGAVAAPRFTAAVREREAAGPLFRRAAAGQEGAFFGAKFPFPPGPPQRSAVKRFLHVPAAEGSEPAQQASLSGHPWDPPEACEPAVALVTAAGRRSLTKRSGTSKAHLPLRVLC